MTPNYELAILGDVPADKLHELREELTIRLEELGLNTPEGATCFVGQADQFNPSGSRCCACLCFKGDPKFDSYIEVLLQKGIPFVPVSATQDGFSKEMPKPLIPLNGLALDKYSPQQIVAALLECAELLPSQRRVFISYKRKESTEVALQLYADLSARGFDVFLDTHKIHPGAHFQEMLWQRLCDCEVLLMLDTDSYFEGRWTQQEFGRAMFRGLAFVRVGWPGIALHPRARAAVNLELSATDFEPGDKVLLEVAVQRICVAVETARTKSVATRFQTLMDTLQAQARRANAKIDGASLRRRFTVTLETGKRVDVYPALGVPTTYTLHSATMDGHPPPVAVVYDDAGIEDRNWRDHMEWVGKHLHNYVRLLPSSTAGWHFNGWV